jgi:hypothetical protein
MKIQVALAVACAIAVSASANAQDVGQLIRAKGSGSVSITFPSKPGTCGDGSSYISTGTDEEGRHSTFTHSSRGFNTTTGSRDYRHRDCREGPVRVDFDVEGGSVTDIDTNVGGSVQGATAVTSKAAVDYLLDLAERSRGSVGKHAILPALLADGVDPAPRLLQIGRNTQASREVRKSAIFWVSQSESPIALAGLKSLLHDPDTEIAKQAVFGISQLRTDEAATVLLAMAREDNTPREVRKQAIFWLGQAAGDKATQGLKSLLNSDDTEVKKQAVFALSQIKSKDSVSALIEVVKTSKDREVRKTALFWLSQSDDPRVIALLEDILIKQ